MSDKLKAIAAEYHALGHAMQSGVAMEMQLGSTDTLPKHLRVGVNSALADQSSLARLLIAKGVITEEEYLTAIRDGMRQEVDRYQRALSERLQKKVTLA